MVKSFASLNETFYFSIHKNVFYLWTHKYCINYYLLTKREVCTIVKYRTDVFRTDNWTEYTFILLLYLIKYRFAIRTEIVIVWRGTNVQIAPKVILDLVEVWTAVLVAVCVFRFYNTYMYDSIAKSFRWQSLGGKKRSLFDIIWVNSKYLV